jgi:anti-anti-sigma regulatory factor
MIEVAGPLDDYAIPLLRGAIADVVKRAGSPRVLIIEDKITDVSENAALALVMECKALRARGGDIGLISTDGGITQRGRPSSKTLFMQTYNGLELAIQGLSTDPAVETRVAL